MAGDETYFDDDSRPVPAVEPVYPNDEGEADPQSDVSAMLLRERQETIAWMLRVLFYDAYSMEQVARRATAFAYVTKFKDAPAKSIRGLAELLEVSPTRAAQICTAMKQLILEMPRD